MLHVFALIGIVAAVARGEACSEARVLKLDELIYEERHAEAWAAWEQEGPCPEISPLTWLGLIGYALDEAPDRVSELVRAAPTGDDGVFARAVAALLVDAHRAPLALEVLAPWPPVEVDDVLLDVRAHIDAGHPEAEARWRWAWEVTRQLPRPERRAARDALRSLRRDLSHRTAGVPGP